MRLGLMDLYELRLAIDRVRLTPERAMPQTKITDVVACRAFFLHTHRNTLAGESHHRLDAAQHARVREGRRGGRALPGEQVLAPRAGAPRNPTGTQHRRRP